MAEKYKMRLCDKAALLGMEVEREHIRSMKKDVLQQDLANGAVGAYYCGYAAALKLWESWLSGFIERYKDMFQA